ncbi:MAG TPA: hypothetical protein VFN97_03030 [Actinospica sp.]|nr:hypothetical protein [Actinospica sp.]
MRVTKILAAGSACAALLALGAGPASASASTRSAAQPSGLYAGMGTCPLSSAALQDANNGEVGCVVATIGGGSVTIGSITVPLTSTMTAKFGAYWPNNGPTVTFADGNSAEIFDTVAPTDGNELSSAPLDVPIPGLANWFPGVTSAIVQVQLAGPITDFTPLADGENYPLFQLPLKFHLMNLFLGPNCYVGSSAAPILLQPTTGTTAPPSPNQPITGSAGTVSLNADPNGYGTLVVGFSGASLVDNAFAVPAASGCGIAGSLDWLVDLLFGLGSAAGHNTAVLSGVDTSLAADSSISDLTAAIAASE